MFVHRKQPSLILDKLKRHKPPKAQQIDTTSIKKFTIISLCLWGLDAFRGAAIREQLYNSTHLLVWKKITSFSSEVRDFQLSRFGRRNECMESCQGPIGIQIVVSCCHSPLWIQPCCFRSPLAATAGAFLSSPILITPVLSWRHAVGGNPKFFSSEAVWQLATKVCPHRMPHRTP